MTAYPDDQLRTARQCLRRLILPIPFGDEENAVLAMLEAAAASGVAVADLPDFIDLRVREWEAGMGVSSDFAELVSRTLGVIGCPGAERIRSRYFDLHRIALSDPSGLSHLQCRQLLSHLPLMAMLCSVERMSASQIARVLWARDSRVECSWEAIRRILEAIGIYQALDLSRFKSLFAADVENEEAYFADSAPDECLRSVADLGSVLGLESTTLDDLKLLLPADADPLYSTLEMLHYQLMIAEFYDHALTFTYEHKPRGEAMNWLHGQYPDSIKAGKQPFLNIAKSLYRISKDWALARDRPEEAVAITRILEDVESLGFPAKREISEKLRWLIHRYIKRFSDAARFIPDDFPIEGIRAAAKSVARDPSKTFGILEQRLVDAIADAIHAVEHGWHPSAIGQSVFASNRSLMKFGDCEFLNHAENLITAYEAHGGKATRWYLEDHISTLPTTVAKRFASLEENFDLRRLRVRIVFVAHEFEASAEKPPGRREIGGIRFEFENSTFLEMLAEVGGERLDQSLRRHFALALNNSLRTMTPQKVRDRFMELAVVD